ncbi:MAG: hypothetical protein WD063_04355 [Pirellulales bacterium]
MVSKSTSGLVGLIVIESSGTPDDLPALDVANHDATLGQILAWLARGNRVEGGEVERAAGRLGANVAGAISRSSVRRSASRLFGRDRPPLVAADCRGLGAQLEWAAVQLRRTIAVEGANAR